ncbi:MAG: RnfABCDGE type electron transport complex subunit B [Spartobacteria bacterium]|nr:RnfABCDGE type electron transport complex subunit B [Spartobacteria bacterium]
MGTIVIILSAAIMLALAIIMGFILGWANKTFHVDVDPRVEAVTAALPGANCGGCGFVGCGEYAEAVVAGRVGPDKCPVGGDSVAATVAEILGLSLEQSWPYRPVVHCGAGYEERLGRHEYTGEQTCAAANLINGVQACTYGCLGFGDCTRACDFDAIHIVAGLATVDYEKCVGCGACAKVCPRNIISMVPFKNRQMLAIACSNKDMGKEVKAVCKVGCIGCKACQRNDEGLFTVEDNLPRINYENYDPANMDAAAIAVQKCPMKRIISVGKPTTKDMESLADVEVPALIVADFKTTVDNTDWQG